MINNLINNSSQAGIRIKEPHDTAVWAGFEILPFEIENLVHSGQQVTETRLTYNCAHLRLNNKKNKLSQKGPWEWTLILEKNDFTDFPAI